MNPQQEELDRGVDGEATLGRHRINAQSSLGGEEDFGQVGHCRRRRRRGRPRLGLGVRIRLSVEQVNEQVVV